MKKQSLFISNRAAYGKGFEAGIQLGLDAKKINFKSLHPVKALLSPHYLTSHIAGVRDGYRQALWKYQREKQAKRLQELSQLQHRKSRDTDKER